VEFFCLDVGFNGKLLTGEVTHTNIPAGHENRSVTYMPPRARCLELLGVLWVGKLGG
jgi:hypothetical protein